jgi:hypothetical protein
MNGSELYQKLVLIGIGLNWSLIDQVPGTTLTFKTPANMNTWSGEFSRISIVSLDNNKSLVSVYAGMSRDGFASQGQIVDWGESVGLVKKYIKAMDSQLPTTIP